MRRQTELMRAVLTSPKAQEMIDYVSPIYGSSYVGVWLFQAIGTVMGAAYDIAEKLRNEMNPATADLLLDAWEDHYGIARDTALTKEQRRTRIIAKTQSRGACNPKKMEAAVSAALGGARVEITENVAQNTFMVNIRDVVESINPAVAVIERMKPAHLIYRMQVATNTVSEADLKIAIATTQTEYFKVEVRQ